MAKRTILTKQELIEKYSSLEVRERILDLLDLRSFLAHSIIRANYKIPDALNNAIALSDYGDELLRSLGQKKVPTKEARLICFLEFYHLDLLIDPMAIDVEALALAVGDELIDGHLLLPFVHGPQLYERAAALFQDERSYLGASDSLRLLEGTPQGVFQSGRRLSGPYGILTSDAKRGLVPTTSIPLQHCHDASCRSVHRVSLSTEYTAPINEHRAVAAKVLDSQSEDPSEFGLFFAEIAENHDEFYDDFSAGALPVLIGESLADEELRELFAYLLDSGPRLRQLVDPLGLSGPARVAASALSRAQLVQIILLVSDRVLLSALDSLVFSGEIQIPEGEIRRPVLMANANSGAFSVTPELSRSGVRLQSHRRALGPLRLRRLIDHIFASDRGLEVTTGDFEDTEELGWQLRGVKGVNVLSRLDEYLRTESPEAVLRRLVLARRQNVETAAKDLGLELTQDVDDATIIDRMLWKLGFDNEYVQPLRERFWLRHERMTQSARSASVSTIVDQEAMRGLSANYFVALEELLADTLAFSSWVLLSDHHGSKKPFQYDSANNRIEGLQYLTEFHHSVAPAERDPLTFNEKSTLHTLCEGFGVLANKLDSMVSNIENWERPTAEYPDFAGSTRLQLFPFKHKAIFLDLTVSSRKEIVRMLRDASRELISAKVAEVRNEQLHYRRSSGDLDKLLHALAAVETVIHHLEDAGLVRSMFYPDRRESDRWGRSTVYFADRRGREIAFGQPASFMWLNLPRLDEPQYLVTAAQFADPNEILRITLRAHSAFQQMWGNIPMRRQSSRQEASARRDSSSLVDSQQAQSIG